MPQNKKKKETVSLQDFQATTTGGFEGSWADSAEDDSFGANRFDNNDNNNDRGGRYGDNNGGRYGGDRGGDRGGRYGDNDGGRYGGDRGGRYGGGGGGRYGDNDGGRYGDRGGRYGGGGGGRYGDNDGGRYGGGGDRYERRDRPQKEAPNEPPFIAFLGNLPYDIKEHEIGEYFEEQLHCKVTNIRLPEDSLSGRRRGYGYVTFEDRDSLVEALKCQGEQIFGGRALKVDVAEEKQQREQRSNRADQVDVWERGKKVPQRENRGFNNRSYNSNRRGGDRGGFNRNYNDNDRQERPKLNVQPRSNSGNKSGARQTNIFGEAKPRDEAEYQRRRAEEKKKREEQKAKAKPESTSADTTKAAATTDAPKPAKQTTTTAQKEKTVENRFAALSVDE